MILITLMNRNDGEQVTMKGTGNRFSSPVRHLRFDALPGLRAADLAGLHRNGQRAWRASESDRVDTVSRLDPYD